MSGFSRRIVVTGLGCVSPCGLTMSHTWRNVLAGNSGIRSLHFEDFPEVKCKVAGIIPRKDNVNDFDFAQDTTKKGDDGDSTRFCFSDEHWKRDAVDSQYRADVLKFSLSAATEAVEQSWLDAAIDCGEVDGQRVGVSWASCLGGMDMIHSMHHKMLVQRKARRISPFDLPSILTNTSGSAIAKRFALKGPNLCSASACAASSHSLAIGYQNLVTGFADAMVCGGAEASLTPMAIQGFAQCKALSKYENPQIACRPFDKYRRGFVQGEGSAVLILETLDSAQKRGVTPLVELVGVAMGCDAFHLTNIDPTADEITNCMESAINHAANVTGLSALEIKGKMAYVNAHATSTEAGDSTEALAIARCFEPVAKERRASGKPLMVGSTKSSTSHLLAAAGAIEACVTVSSLLDGRIAPNLNLETLDPSIHEVAESSFLTFPTERTDIDCEQFPFAMSNSFGFGGTNGSLVFKVFSD